MSVCMCMCMCVCIYIYSYYQVSRICQERLWIVNNLLHIFLQTYLMTIMNLSYNTILVIIRSLGRRQVHTYYDGVGVGSGGDGVGTGWGRGGDGVGTGWGRGGDGVGTEWEHDSHIRLSSIT